MNNFPRSLAGSTVLGVTNNKQYQTSWDYWQQQLQGLESHCNLPTDRPYWHLESQQAKTISHPLAIDLGVELDRFCETHTLSPFALSQSVFAILLSRYTMQNDMLIGTCVANPEGSQEGKQESQANPLVLRSQVDAELDVITWINKNAATIDLAYQHAIVPFSELAKAFAGDSDDAAPLFQVMFTLIDKPGEQAPITAQSDHYLDVCLEYSDDQWLMHWKYLEDIFDPLSIRRMAENYEHLLLQVLKYPNKPINTLESLAPTQKQYIDALWNHKQIDADKTITVVDLFLDQAAKKPDSNAICCENTSITYRLLEEHSARLAGQLMAKGIGSGDLVGLYLEDPIERVISLLALLRAGAAYLPFDNLLDCQREHYILQAAQPKALMTHSQMPLELGESLDSTPIIDYQGAMQASAASYQPVMPSPENLAYVIYTSGSQGKPNGVMGSHQGIVNRVLWSLNKLGTPQGQVHCQLSSFSHVDHVAEIFQALGSGSLLVLPKRDIRQNPADIAKLIHKHRVTRLGILPSVLQQLLNVPEQVEQCVSLREIFCSGEILHGDTAQACCNELPHCRLFNIYGSTEVSADASYYEVQNPNRNDLQAIFTDGYPSQPVQAPSISGFNHLVDTNAERLITEADVGLEILKKAFVSADIPEFPTAIENYVALLKKDILPYAINVSSPRFIGHMTSALPQFVPEFSKELVALNQNLVKIETSKAFTFVERQVLAMLHKLCFNSLDYDKLSQSAQAVLGVFTGGGTLSNITALWCARNHALLAQGISKADLQKKGSVVALHNAGFTDSVIIASPLAHYSLRKAASLLGIGEDNILRVGQRADQSLDIDHLHAIIKDCRDNKRLIIAMVGIAGATETGTIDPLEAMAEIAQRQQIHFHVDAAWGGSLLFSSLYRSKIAGIEQADTVTICAHKQLYMPQGISLCLIKGPEMMHGSSIHAEYQGLKDSYDLGQYSLEGSRPATSMVLHAALYLLSKQGYGRLVDYSMELADDFRHLVIDTPGFELVGEPQINIINYCYIPAAIRKSTLDYSASECYQISEAVESIQQEQFIRGYSFVSKTRIVHPAWGEEKITVFRVVLSNPLTTPDDLRAVMKDQAAIAQQVIEQQAWQTVSLDKPRLNDPATDTDRHCKIPIGQPIDNTQIYILDPYGNETPLGGVGEIYIAGQGLAQGYWAKPDLSEKKFITTSPVASRLYRTGDLGRINSSNELEYLGRSDAQIKIGGVRVDLAEIELSLQCHESIQQAAVIKKAQQGSQAEDVIWAFICLKPSDDQEVEAQAQAVLGYLHQQLPLEMIPSQLRIVAQLPSLPNGKLDRQGLEEQPVIVHLTS